MMMLLMMLVVIMTCMVHGSRQLFLQGLQAPCDKSACKYLRTPERKTPGG